MWRRYIHAMTVPVFKSLAAPLRNVRVTGPEVVGVQVRVAGCPAVTVKPDETVGGFGPVLVCAMTAASKQARAEMGARRMMMVLDVCLFLRGMRLIEQRWLR